MSNTPKVRFKGFGEEWEWRRLSAYLTVSTLKNRDKVYGREDVLSVSGDYGIVNQIEFQGRSFAGESVINYGVVETGDVVYTKSPLKSNPYGIIKTNKGNAGIVSTLYAVYKPTALTDPYFVQIYFEQDARMNNYMHPLVNKGAKNDMKVSAVNALKGDVIFPGIIEQNKIVKCFEKIDYLIILHQKKCDETKELKKYMLKKLFPQNGKKVPEIRFEGFDGDWEQKKLGEMFCSLQNNTLSRADLSIEQGEAKNIHYGDILVKFGEVLDIGKEHLPMVTDGSIIAKYKASFLQNGDIVVADTAEDETVGKCSEIAGLNQEIVIAGLHTIPYRPVIRFASGYLGYFMNSSAYHRQLLPLMQGIKVTSISKSAMQDTDIMYPESQDEQAKIGAYFCNLDHLITLHQRKCNELKDLKKFMLQNMFPQKG